MAAAAIAGARRRTGRRPSRARRLQFAALAGAWLAWEGLAASGLVYRGVVPSTVAIAAALARLAATPGFWLNLAVTFYEIAAALVLGGLAGVAAGVAIGQSRRLAAVAGPLVDALASTPKVVFLPVLYLVFGIGAGSKIAVAALAAFLPVAISVIAGMLDLDPILARVGRSFGLSRRQMAVKIYLPALVAPIASGLRLAVGAAIAVCLVAETRFSFAGLGHMVADAYGRSRFAEVYAVLAIIAALAVGASWLVGRAGEAGRR